MEHPNPPKPDRLGADYKQGPNPNPGGEIDTGDSAIPPYEGRSLGTGDSSRGERSATGEEQRDVPDRPESLEDTRHEAEMAPDHVGESVTRRGEDVVKREGKEPGRIDTGSDEGTAGRPTGTSTLRDQTSVDPDADGTA